MTPQQAEIVTLGQTLGDLSLVLNSVRDGGDPETDSPGPIDLAEDGVAAGGGEARPRGQQPPAAPHDARLRRDLAPARQLAAGDRDKKQAVKGESPVPLPDRTTKVQVVRGVQSRAIQLGPRPPQRPLRRAAPRPSSASAPTTE